MKKVGLRVRYQKVLESLGNDYIFKSALSGLLWLFFTLKEIFTTSAELVLLLLVVVIVDWISGILSSKRHGVEIQSIGLRQTIVKGLEYSLFLLVLTGVSNVFSTIDGNGWVATLFRATENIDVFGYFYITLTEVKSIAENLTGNKGTIHRLFREIKRKVFDDNNVDI